MRFTFLICILVLPCAILADDSMPTAVPSDVRNSWAWTEWYLSTVDEALANGSNGIPVLQDFMFHDKGKDSFISMVNKEDLLFSNTISSLALKLASASDAELYLPILIEYYYLGETNLLGITETNQINIAVRRLLEPDSIGFSRRHGADNIRVTVVMPPDVAGLETCEVGSGVAPKRKAETEIILSGVGYRTILMKFRWKGRNVWLPIKHEVAHMS